MGKINKIEFPSRRNEIKNNWVNPYNDKTVWDRITENETKDKIVTKKSVTKKVAVKPAAKTKTTKTVKAPVKSKQILAPAKTVKKEAFSNVPSKHLSAFSKGKIVNKMSIEGKSAIIKVNDLRLGFTSKTSNDFKEVIRGLSLNVYEGEVLGILGESGSGKSVLTSAMLGILSEQSKTTKGFIKIHGVDVSHWGMNQWDKSRFRGSVITSVFQNPMKTLNPVQSIGKQVVEALVINNRVESKKEAFAEAERYLSITKIKNIKQVMKMYPHELSGGMIQRVVIAIALATDAQVIVMDEPTTALDPMVQAEIINLIIEIKNNFKTSFIFITHDIGVIAAVSDRVAVMYAGRIAEYGTVKDIVNNPQHPYTWNLLMAMPDLNKDDILFTIPGSVPSDSTEATNEVFAPRNAYALDIDFKEESPLYQLSPSHFVYSRLVDKKAPSYNPPKEILRRWKVYKGVK